MRLRIPPVVQFLVCAVLIVALSWVVTPLRLDWPFLWFAGCLLAGAGTVILLLAVAAFLRARTTVNPVDPGQAETLVTTGLFSLSRNPMYLGMLLLLLGGSAMLSNLAAFAVPVVFVWAMTVLQIKPEEEALQENFGDAYTAYRARTRRWI